MDPYAPLDPARKEIRLLEIVSPEGSASPLECRLSTVSLLQHQSFAALSYVWGDPTLTTDVLVDGIGVRVTTNLADALAHVKRHWRRLYPDRDVRTFRLWADALCIHQENLPEKGHQIPLMKEIFNQAEVVFSWLASGDETIDTAFTVLDIIARETVGFSSRSPPVEWMSKYPMLYAETLSQPGEPEERADVWAAVDRFKKLPNWRRVWTFQELVLGNHIVFLNGDNSLPYNVVDRGIAWHKAFQTRVNRLDKKMMRPSFIPSKVWDSMTLFGRTSHLARVRWARVEDEQNISAWHLIAIGLSASEPRDQVYGLMGVIGKGSEHHFDVDYVKPIEEIYTEAMKKWIEQDQELTTIMCLANHSRRKPGSKLPTWVPDLRALGEGDASHFQIRYGSASRKIYSESQLRLTVEGMTLCAPGIEFNTVKRVFHVLDQASYCDLSLYNFCVDYVSKHPVDATGERPFTAIVRVLVTDSLPVRASTIGAFILLLLDFKSPASSSKDAVQKAARRLGLGSRYFLAPGSADAVGPCFRRLKTIEGTFCLFETMDGHLGLARSTVETGDKVCILRGCNPPVILRAVNDRYECHGTCFVLGIMNGEADEMTSSAQDGLTLFNID